VYEMDGRLFRLPASARAAPKREEVAALVTEALRGIVAEEWLAAERVEHCIKALRPLSVGGLKSLLQKAVRFHSKTVDLSLTDAEAAAMESNHPPSALVAAVSAALLFCEAGTFSPELQLYTRGSTSALKRTAVIMVEDAWVEGAEQGLLALMALTLATQRMPEYEPNRGVILATVRLAAQAVDSPSLIAWRDTAAARPGSTKRIPVSAAGIKALKQSWELLNIVRSFDSDIKMFEKVARSAAKANELRLLQSAAAERMTVMPVQHMMDQHSYRGIAHVGPALANTFAKRFSMIFGKTTGFNPRYQQQPGFEQQPAVLQTRFAQLCCAKFAFKRPARAQLKPVDGEKPVELRLQLDSGVLAAAVGPIAVKVKGEKGRQREVLVMLGVRCPEDEVVMLKPAREFTSNPPLVACDL